MAIEGNVYLLNNLCSYKLFLFEWRVIDLRLRTNGVPVIQLTFKLRIDTYLRKLNYRKLI